MLGVQVPSARPGERAAAVAVAPPHPRPLPRVPPGPPGPAGGASAACVSQIPKQTSRVRAAVPGVTIVAPPPPPHPHLGLGGWIARPRDPALLLGFPSQFWELGAGSSPPAPPSFLSRWVSALGSLQPAPLSRCRISWGSDLSVCPSAAQSLSSPSLSLAPTPGFAVSLCMFLPNSPALPGCVCLSVRLSRSPWLPLSPAPPHSPLPSPGAGGHRTAARHQQSMTKTLSFCC